METKTVEQIERLNAEVKTIETLVTEHLKKQKEEMKQHGSTSAATSKQLAEAEKKYDQAMANLRGEVHGLNESLKAAQTRADELEAKLKRPGFGGGAVAEFKSIGQRFVESDAFRQHRGDNPSRGAWETTNAASGKCEIGKIFNTGNSLDAKTILARWQEQKTDNLGPSTAPVHGDYSGLRQVLASDYLQQIFFDPQLRQVHLRQYMRVVPTTAERIVYIKETALTNSAGTQQEGALKPLSGYQFAIQTAEVTTIAHGVPVTRQLYLDIPALAGYVDSRLATGILHQEDTEALFGDGNNENMLGVTQHTDIQAYVRGKSNDTFIDSVRRAMTQLQNRYFVPDLIVLSPDNWETIELTKDSQNRYIWAQVAGQVETRLWRVPVLVTTAMVEGKFLVGNFGMGATLWDRESVTIQVFTQHADWALRNQLLVLGEERVGLTVEHGQAFVYGTLGAVGS